MPRAPLPKTSAFPYHLTSRTNNRDWFYLSLSQVWDVFQQKLGELSKEYEVRIFAFVLMANHYHLIADFPQDNLSDSMRYLNLEVSRKIARGSDRTNHIFGGRYKGCLINRSSHLYHAYKYVYRNPVVANMCLRVEEYPYSTIGVLSDREYSFPVFDNQVAAWSPIPRDINSRLTWINNAYSPQESNLLRKALHRKTFSFNKSRELVSTVRNLESQGGES